MGGERIPPIREREKGKQGGGRSYGEKKKMKALDGEEEGEEWGYGGGEQNKTKQNM